MKNKKTIEILRRIQQNRYSVNHLLIMIECQSSPVTMSELASSAKLSTAALTGLCNTLVESKLVKRGTYSDDRRVVTIKTTAAGSKVISEIIGSEDE